LRTFDVHRPVPADHFPENVCRFARVTGACVQHPSYLMLVEMFVKRSGTKPNLAFVQQVRISLPCQPPADCRGKQ
jgi:hypothetical protein